MAERDGSDSMAFEGRAGIRGRERRMLGLPRSNCGKCKPPSCMAFAASLVEGEKCVEDCPPLLEEGMEEKLGKLRERGL